MKQAIEPSELNDLERLFGSILRRPARLELSTQSKEHWWPRLGHERRAEVVLVLPRPGGRLVLIRKPRYPAGIFRLPTGGVDPDEMVLAAAGREAYEETGLEVRPARVLGVVDWTFAHNGQEQAFASYLCLFPTTERPLEATDPDEDICGFKELSWHALGAIANRLKQLPPAWQSWGRQRAIPHELVMESLVAQGL